MESKNPVRLRLIPYNARMLDARKALSITQKTLSMLTGYSTTTLGQIETLKVKPSQDAMEEIASALNLPIDYLFPEQLMEAIREGVFEHRMTELEDAQLIRLSEYRRKHLLPTPEIEQIDLTIDRENLRAHLEHSLQSVSTRARKVLELRYGLIDQKPKTLEEVADIYNVSRERIRQIEVKALRRLRHPSRSRWLKEFLHLG